jgi:Kef-type K+ transport system membrane component KefB
VNLNPAAVLPWVLLDLCVVLVAARIFGRAAVKLRQPPVIGEIVAGVALGPSLLGLLPGHLDKALFPAGVILPLNVLAQVGLVLFMFLLGLEMDVTLLRGREGAAAAISLPSIIAPFGLGALLALFLYPHHHTVAENFGSLDRGPRATRCQGVSIRLEGNRIGPQASASAGAGGDSRRRT